MRVGLMQLKGLREAALEALLEERKKRPFASLEDFLCRVDIDPSDVKILIKAGAMDSIAGGATRPEMIWKALAWHETKAARRAVARSLFQDMPAVEPPRVPQYSARTVLEHELETLDFLISRHPLELYREPLARLKHVRGADLHKHVGRRVTTIGWWVTGKVVTTQGGRADGVHQLRRHERALRDHVLPANLRALLPHAEPLAPVRADRPGRGGLRRRHAHGRLGAISVTSGYSSRVKHPRKNTEFRIQNTE